MSNPDGFSVKEIIAAVVVLILLGVGVFISVGVFKSESVVTEVVISDASKDPNHVQVFVKLLTIDPIKGDATVRMELDPADGSNILDEEGGLAQPLKLYIPSANGKTEIEFKKGQSLAPVEAVLQMYGGNAADYPFDNHKAGFYAMMEKLEDKSAEKRPAAPAPAPAGEDAPDEKPAVKEVEPPSPFVKLDVSFFGSIPGYSITASKIKDADEDLVAGEIDIKRSGTVIAFSTFVAVLMWGLSLAVLFLVLSVVLRGRKPELAMFSFMAALLFAFYAVRNSQPNVPPIGVYGDFISFFWAETLVGVCLLVTIFTWVFRPAK
jgi:hypothetical protein